MQALAYFLKIMVMAPPSGEIMYPGVCDVHCFKVVYLLVKQLSKALESWWKPDCLH